MKFRLIEAERARHSVSLLCSALGVTRAGFYAWKRRGPCARELRDRELCQLIEGIFKRSRQTYGVPRVHAELQDEHQVKVSRKRVARLMRRLGIEGVSRRGKRPLTTKRAEPRPALGRGHHLRSDLGGLPVPRRRARRVEPSLRGLVDARRSLGGSGDRRARDGGHQAQTSARRDPPFRQ
jgi:helix-turn-helix protein